VLVIVLKTLLLPFTPAAPPPPTVTV